MVKRINGVSQQGQPAPIPVIKEGKVVPLPPLAELHAVDLPGGNLHRGATLSEAGFMSAEQVHDLEDIKVRPQLDPGDFAKADHQHLDRSIESIPEHVHGELQTRLNDLTAEIRKGMDSLQALATRNAFDPAKWAPEGHAHPQVPPLPHGHSDLDVAISSVRTSVEALRLVRTTKDEVVEAFGRRLDKLEDDLKFVRELLERSGDKITARQEHGNQAGGRLHAVVTERRAGFMSVEMLRKLDSLWEDR